MTIYYVIYSLIGITALLYSNRVIFTKKMFCAFCFSLIFIMFALRHPTMGVDIGYGGYTGYWPMFAYISDMPWIDVFTIPVKNYEVGYTVLNKIISCFTDNAQWLLAVCAAIVFFFFGKTVYQNSEMPCLSILIMVGLPSFAGNYSSLRQAIAVAIVFAAYTQIKNKKMIRFLVLVTIATLFHKTALLAVAAYPVYWFRPAKKLRILSCAILVLAFLFRYQLFYLLKNLLKPHATIDSNNAVNLFVVFCLMYIFFFVFMDHNDNESNGFLNIFWIACFCQAMAGLYSTAIRVGWYFMNVCILLIPKVLQYQKKKYPINKIILNALICACFVVFGLLQISNTTWAVSNPYYFFWSEL